MLGALRDAEAADELAQEFALRFIAADFSRANPERGRFRDYVKGVLSHLIADHHRKRRRVRNLSGEAPEQAAPDPSLDRGLLKTWRDELIHQAWDALAKQQDRIGKPFHTVLRFRIDHPNMRSAQIAEQLSGQFGARVTAFWVRQSLHRAREKFIDFLIETVEATMSRPTIEELESELGELGLLTFCGPALERRRGKN